MRMHIITEALRRDVKYPSRLAFAKQVRKLEFLVADALQRKADTLVTIGGIQSNHCRATAVAARCHSWTAIGKKPSFPCNLCPAVQHSVLLSLPQSFDCAGMRAWIVT